MFEFLLPLALLICHALYWVVYQHTFLLLDNFYFSVAIALSLAYLICTLRDLKTRDKKSWPWMELALFSILLGIGLYVVDVRSIWIDEYSQYLISKPRSTFFSLTVSAASEQQPPFGYMMTGISTMLLGTSLMGLRFGSVVFMSLATVSLYRLMRDFRISCAIAFLSILLFLTRPLVFDFFTEGKSYALAIFFAVSLMGSYLRLLYQFEKFSFFRFTFYSFFLVSSLSLQTGVMAVALFFAFAFLGNKKVTMRILSANVLAAAFFLPLALNIFYSSKEQDQFKEAQVFSEVLHKLSNYFELFWQLLYAQFSSFMSLIFLAPLFFLALLLVKENRKLILFLLASLLIFYVLFILSYGLFINWSFYLKYFFLSFPIIIFFFALSLQYFADRWIPKRRLHQGVFALLIFVNMIPALLDFEKVSEVMVDNRRMTWSLIYSYLADNTKSDDTVYFLTFNDPAEWSVVKPVGKEFFEGKIKAFLASERFIPANILSVPAYRREELTKGDVFLISAINWSDDHLSDELLMNSLAHLKIEYWSGARIMILKENGQSQRERLIDLFELIDSHYGNMPWTFTMKVSLAHLYLIEDRREDYLKVVTRMRQMTFSKRLNSTGMEINRSGLVQSLIPFL